MNEKLILGDCLEKMKEIPDGSVDCVITDPPYGISVIKTGFVGGSKSFNKTKAAKLTNYGKSDWDNFVPSKEYFDEIMRISKNQIIFGGNYFILPPSPCWIVWDKVNEDSPFADCELAWTSFKSAVRKVKYRWNGMLQEDMKNKEYRVHPTQKPVGVMKWIIEKYTEEGQIICDPFMGSGTTGVACVHTKRNFIGIEKDETYFKIAQERILNAQLPLL